MSAATVMNGFGSGKRASPCLKSLMSLIMVAWSNTWQKWQSIKCTRSAQLKWWKLVRHFHLLQKRSCIFSNYHHHHLQSPVHRNTSLFQSPSADPRLCVESSVVRHSSAGSASRGVTLKLCDFLRNDFAGRAFRHSAPAVWNSLPRTVLESTSLTVFKSRLKTHLFHLAHNNGQ